MDFWDKMELGANWIADPKYNLIQNGSMIQIEIRSKMEFDPKYNLSISDAKWIS